MLRVLNLFKFRTIQILNLAGEDEGENPVLELTIFTLLEYSVNKNLSIKCHILLFEKCTIRHSDKKVFPRITLSVHSPTSLFLSNSMILHLMINKRKFQNHFFRLKHDNIIKVNIPIPAKTTAYPYVQFIPGILTKFIP